MVKNYLIVLTNLQTCYKCYRCYKNSFKKAIQKTAEANGDLIGNNGVRGVYSPNK